MEFNQMITGQSISINNKHGTPCINAFSPHFKTMIKHDGANSQKTKHYLTNHYKNSYPGHQVTRVRLERETQVSVITLITKTMLSITERCVQLVVHRLVCF